MAKAKTPQQLKKKLWELCKQIVRKRDGTRCVICGKGNLEGSNAHTGHFLPSSTCGAYLRYDIRNLHLSCYNCNINLGGNGAQFYVVLKEKYGETFVKKIFTDKNITIKADVLYYTEQIEEYETLLAKNWGQSELFDYTKKRRK